MPASPSVRCSNGPGDVFGPTVNIAARTTGLARSGVVLVDRAFRNELGDDPGFHIERRPRGR